MEYPRVHPIDFDRIGIAEQAAHPYPANDLACLYDVKYGRDKGSSADHDLAFSVWISNNEIWFVERIPAAEEAGIFTDPVSPANYAVLIQHRAGVAVHSPINLTKELAAPRYALLVRGNGYRFVTPHP